MSKSKRVADAIKSVVALMMDRVLNNVLINDPFIKEKHHSAKPLYAALVPDEIFKGAHFERRFVTPFGGLWEKLAHVVAIEAHGHCELSHSMVIPPYLASIASRGLVKAKSVCLKSLALARSQCETAA